MPLYRCKGKNCDFATDDIGEYVRHIIKEETSPPKETRRHKTARDYLECPSCASKFEKEFLARGYMKPEEKEKESDLTL